MWKHSGIVNTHRRFSSCPQLSLIRIRTQNLPSPGRRRIHIFVQIQSLILSGKNVLQELLSRELKTMRHVSFIKNLDNLDANRYSDRQSSNFLTIEIQSNLNLRGNGLYAAKSIECSNYKQGRTFSFIKQVLNKIIQFLPCHVLVLSFGRILNHIEHFIEERCSFYILCRWTSLFL